VHVGHHLWQMLALDAVLAQAGLSARTRVLTEIMTLNRLVSPRSEHAMPELGPAHRLGRHPGRELRHAGSTSRCTRLSTGCTRGASRSSGALAERERTLFTLDDRIFLYDLTSTYLRGSACRIRRRSADTRGTAGRTASR